MTTFPSDAASPAPKPRPDLRAVETAQARDAAAGPAADPALDPGPPAEPQPAPDPLPEAAAAAPRARRRAMAAAAAQAKPRPRSAAKTARRTAARKAAGKPPRKAAPKAGAQRTRAAAAKAAPAARGVPAKRKPAAPRRRPAPRALAATPAAVVAALAAAAAAPEVVPARLKTRHWVTILSFALLVLAPFAAAVGYLYTRAADRYHSEVAFSIRSEEAASAAAGILGALTSIGVGSASDADILYEYVRSQGIVEAIDAELDLRAIYARAANDPVFTLAEGAPVEDLVAHWRRMVDVAFETTAGIIHARAQAFAPEDATAIARAILEKSSALVNQLSEQARADAIRFAEAELAEAEANLRAQRQRLSEFRRANRIVDPSGDVAGQSGLLNALQAELAQALVERDMLLSFVGDEDQRVIQANRRITAVEGRIEAERASLGVSGVEGALPDVVGRYEELLVDLEFANTSYTQALAGLAAARAEARRQSRYLAPHVRPTFAERALYPRRALLAGLIGLFLTLGWGAAMLVYYNVRDNR